MASKTPRPKARSTGNLGSQARLPSLDGWRALSIILVLISHSDQTSGYPSAVEPALRWLPNGEFGVEVFFVISGFLITYLLLNEHQVQSRISLKNFYMRRVIRIFPAYFTFLTAILIITLLAPLALHWGQWLRLLTFTSNFTWLAVPGYNPWPVAHTWTLAIEEQFYLLWPITIVLLSKSGMSAKRLMLACAVPILFAPIARVLSHLDYGGIAFAPFSFLVKADSIAWGCLFGVLYGSKKEALEKHVERFPLAIAGFALIAIAIPLFLTRLFLLGMISVPFTQTLHALGISLLIILSIKYPMVGPFRALNWKPVMMVGVWSYSIYLWQQLFCTNPALFGLEQAPWYLSFPFWIIAAILAGMASYYLVERPFLGLRSKFRS